MDGSYLLINFSCRNFADKLSYLRIQKISKVICFSDWNSLEEFFAISDDINFPIQQDRWYRLYQRSCPKGRATPS